MRVSVLIDTYNHERFIEQAIASALEQDFPAREMEILVVDDGSTDRTPEIARKFGPRVRFLRKDNGGQASAFNAGLRELSGEIVCFLDGDDWWAKDKISRVARAFEENPAIAVVGHGYHEVDDHGLIHRRWLPGPGARLSFETPERALRSTPLRIFLGTSRLSVRRKVFESIAPLPSDFTICADTVLFTLALALGDAVILDEPLCFYRVHQGSLYSYPKGGSSQARTKFRLLQSELNYLPPQLARFGVSSESIAAFLEGDRVEEGRLRLALDGGKRGEAFRVERQSFLLAQPNPGMARTIFKWLVLFLTLLLPPKVFYRLRGFYAERKLRQSRDLLAPTPPSESNVTLPKEHRQTL